MTVERTSEEEEAKRADHQRCRFVVQLRPTTSFRASMAQGAEVLNWLRDDDGLRGRFIARHNRLAAGALETNVYRWIIAFSSPDTAFHVRLKFG